MFEKFLENLVVIILDLVLILAIAPTLHGIGCPFILNIIFSSLIFIIPILYLFKK